MVAAAAGDRLRTSSKGNLQTFHLLPVQLLQFGHGQVEEVVSLGRRSEAGRVVQAEQNRVAVGKLKKERKRKRNVFHLRKNEKKKENFSYRNDVGGGGGGVFIGSLVALRRGFKAAVWGGLMP